MIKNPKVDIYTDGGCRGNGESTAVGAAASLLHFDDNTAILLGYGTRGVTNNQMELQAAIQALKSLKGPHRVHVYSDSKYVVDAFRAEWIKKWQRSGWKTSSGTPVKNRSLWEELIKVIKDGGHEVTFNHVRGHNGHYENELMDQMANRIIDALETTDEINTIIFDKSDVIENMANLIESADFFNQHNPAVVV